VYDKYYYNVSNRFEWWTRCVSCNRCHKRELDSIIDGTRTLTKHEKSLLEPYELHDGVLYREHVGHLLQVVPWSMRKGIVIDAHDFGGHFSLDRTIAKITENYWYTGLRRYIVKQHTQIMWLTFNGGPDRGRSDRPGKAGC